MIITITKANRKPIIEHIIDTYNSIYNCFDLAAASDKIEFILKDRIKQGQFLCKRIDSKEDSKELDEAISWYTSDFLDMTIPFLT